MNYYVGIDPKDRERFMKDVHLLNVEIINEYDDTHGYYTFYIKGTSDSYEHFLNNAIADSYVRSLEHFKE